MRGGAFVLLDCVLGEVLPLLDCIWGALSALLNCIWGSLSTLLDCIEGVASSADSETLAGAAHGGWRGGSRATGGWSSGLFKCRL